MSTNINKQNASATLRGRSAASVHSAEVDAATPVKMWSLVGAISLVFMIYVWAKWVSGPFFMVVPSGPDTPPMWMKTVLISWTLTGIATTIAVYYWFLVRPWRMERKLTTDGALVLAFSVLWFQDPLSNYLGHWFVYNSWLWNMGSWVNEIPGWLAYGEPGKTIPEPLLWTAPMYVYVFLGASQIGCWAMRAAKARWPMLSGPALMLICFFTMGIADLVLEGFLILPAGIFMYPGGHYSIFADTYHKFPLHEVLFAGMLFTAIASVRYFKNDRGETIAERGLSSMRISERRLAVLRALAMIGVTQVAILLIYNVPCAIFIGAHSDDWPEDLVKRSYMTDYLCGSGTDRLCPGRSVPNPRGPNAPYVNGAGQLVIPPGQQLPKIVPFESSR